MKAAGAQPTRRSVVVVALLVLIATIGCTKAPSDTAEAPTQGASPPVVGDQAKPPVASTVAAVSLSVLSCAQIRSFAIRADAEQLASTIRIQTDLTVTLVEKDIDGAPWWRVCVGADADANKLKANAQRWVEPHGLLHSYLDTDDKGPLFFVLEGKAQPQPAASYADAYSAASLPVGVPNFRVFTGPGMHAVCNDAPLLVVSPTTTDCPTCAALWQDPAVVVRSARGLEGYVGLELEGPAGRAVVLAAMRGNELWWTMGRALSADDVLHWAGTTGWILHHARVGCTDHITADPVGLPSVSSLSARPFSFLDNLGAFEATSALCYPHMVPTTGNGDLWQEDPYCVARLKHLSDDPNKAIHALNAMARALVIRDRKPDPVRWHNAVSVLNEGLAAHPWIAQSCTHAPTPLGPPRLDVLDDAVFDVVHRVPELAPDKPIIEGWQGKIAAAWPARGVQLKALLLRYQQ
jgi:hypothetical protein